MSRQAWSRGGVLVAVCLGVLALQGCGPAGAPKTVKSKIKVQFEDGTALPIEIVLALVPESGTAEYSVSTDLPENGEYRLMTSYQGASLDGAPPGKYKVTVLGAGTAGIKPELESAKTTPLEVEISSSGSATPDVLKIPRG
jgi:hypothetical protein